ncbi:MAG: glycoside hydrolase family 99-like domain-containing protein [Caldilineaceae bacterium]|nr:glycoside hydrolase family 99-like domain-containing protein [Caldilineaceae bacterium]
MTQEQSSHTNEFRVVSPTTNAEQPVRLLWRILYTFLLLLLLALFSLWRGGYIASAATDAQQSGTPLVLAFYYTWFDENTWNYATVPDLPATQYVSRDRAAMGRHIEQAQRAGIDAFLVAWYGPNGDSNQTEANLAALLDEAAARNFRIGILFETTSPFLNGSGDGAAALTHALNVHANHPAFLRVDGKPVIFFWRPSQWSVETWRAIRDQVDPGRNSIWIAEGVDMAYQAVFDGHHLYSNTWNPPSDLSYTNQKFAKWTAAASQQYGTHKRWVATVMPGYDDTRTGRGNAFARDREGGAYYERAWQAAIASNPDWIVITSFNEWPEGTYIEPSVAYGDRFLELTAQWSGVFKSGGGGSSGVVSAASVAQAAPAPAIAPAVVPPAAVTPPPTPVANPTAFVTVALLNLRAGPSTDFAILAQMAQGTALPITGQDPDWPAWWQVSQAGTNGWVYAPLVDAAGPLERVAQVVAPPPQLSAAAIKQILTRLAGPPIPSLPLPAWLHSATEN